jgi:serine/threonine-protein kinase
MTRARGGDPLIGRTIAGYRLDALLARSRTGAVYRARQLAVDRPVALKVLSESLARDRQFLVGFVRRARAAGRLSHPGIVQVHEVLQEGAVVFYSMELVAGGSLARLLSRKERLSWPAARRILLDAVEALRYAEGERVIHGRIDPDHLLLTAGGRVKLLNLGICAGPGEGGRSEAAGRRYQPPEAIEGRELASTADVYALGATLFHVLAGRPPFAEGSEKDLLREKSIALAPRPGEMEGGVPAWVPALIERMTAPAVEARPASFEELRALVRGHLETSREDGWAQGRATGRGARGARGARLALWGAAGVLAVLGVVGVLRLFRPRAEAPPALTPSASPSPSASLSAAPARAVLSTEGEGEREAERVAERVAEGEGEREAERVAERVAEGEGEAERVAEGERGRAALAAARAAVRSSVAELDFAPARAALAELDAKLPEAASPAPFARERDEIAAGLAACEEVHGRLAAAAIPEWSGLAARFRAPPSAGNDAEFFARARSALLRAALEAYAAARGGAGVEDVVHGKTTLLEGSAVKIAYDFARAEELEDFVPAGAAESRIAIEAGRLVLRGEYRLFGGEPFEKRLEVALRVRDFDRAAPNANLALWTAAGERVTYVDHLVGRDAGERGEARGEDAGSAPGYVVFGFGYRPESPLSPSLRFPESEVPILFPAAAILAGSGGLALHHDLRWTCLWGDNLLEAPRPPREIRVQVDGGAFVWTVEKDALHARVPGRARSRIEAALRGRGAGSITLFTNGATITCARLEVSGDLRPGWVEERLRARAARDLEARVPGLPWAAAAVGEGD